MGSEMCIRDRIIKHGGVRWLLTASDEELLRVRGIGRATLKRIRLMLGDIDA